MHEYRDNDETLSVHVPRKFVPLLAPVRYKGASGGRSAAKCLGRGTNVVMYDGMLRAVEDIYVGDRLLGIDGTPRNVLSVSAGTDDLFEIRQLSGQSYIVNNAHILVLDQSKTSLAEGRYQEMAGGLISVSDYLNSSERFKCHFFGYKRAASFPEAEQPLDPYFFGAWLGDGDSARPAITTADPEIVEYLDEFASENDCRLSKFGKPDSLASGYLVARINGTAQENPITGILRSLGVLGNKHVPDCYAIASEKQRLALLAGVIDSDGSLNKNCYVLSQSRKHILKRIKWIADSLGFKTNMRRIRPICNGIEYVAWKLTISGDIWRIPCRVARKVARQSDFSKIRDWRHTRVDVVPIGQGEFFGFELDGDHLFFLEDFTVTHNSHFFCERLIEDCVSQHVRAACIREVQHSLDESVKQLLEDKINGFGLDRVFHITKREIVGPNDSLIVFKGVKSHTAQSIKSLEGFNRAFIEEAQAMSQTSIDTLIPTFRTPGCELWAAWNPIDKDDPIEVFFNENVGDPDFVRIHATYRDNPWLPPESRRDMERMKRRNPDKYQHVWEGKYRKMSEARIFKNWKTEAFKTPKDIEFYFGADWGYSIDPTVLMRCFIIGNTLYIDREAYMVGCEIDYVPFLFGGMKDAKLRELNKAAYKRLKKDGKKWKGIPGCRRWPITADNARPETIAYMRRHGFDSMRPSIKGPSSVEEGIEFLQSYDIVIHPRCKHTIDEFTYYSWKTDPRTDEVIPIPEDKKNHVIDSARYAIERVRRASTWGVA